MTDRPAQCGRTFVHLPHPTTEGDCPGLPPDAPMIPGTRPAPGRRRALPDLAETVTALRREVGPTGGAEGDGTGGWQPMVSAAELWVLLDALEAPAAEPSMMEDFAEAETDPVRSWMLRYPAENTQGPGWGDDDDVEAGRCCPTCRASLTEHNRAVHDAGYEMGQRHALDALQRAANDPVTKPLSRTGVLLGGQSSTLGALRDPWAEPQVSYDVLHAGLRAIASQAVATDDFAGAAYAFSVLAGDPIAPSDDEPDEPADETAPQCGARPHGPGLRPPVGCDRPAGHDHGPHSASYDTGHDGWTTITWED